MRVPAAAKINLHLRIGKVGADGFHPLLTWMCTAGLFDNLIFIRGGGGQTANAAPGQGWFSLTCDDPTLPTDSRNLVVAAATALADTLGRSGEGSTGRRERVSAFLNKSIPAGAGLAGGSSDAASTILALATLWKLNWSIDQLARLAAGLGSDLPFFFRGPSSVCTGRGEIVRPIAKPTPGYAALVLPDIAMPTPLVYRKFDEMKLASEQVIADEPDWSTWTQLRADELLPLLVNDLEAPAFAIEPKLAELRSALAGRWNKVVRMSGSGSSLFTLSDTADEAEQLAKIAREYFRVRAIAVRLAPAVNIFTAKDS